MDTTTTSRGVRTDRDADTTTRWSTIWIIVAAIAAIVILGWLISGWFGPASPAAEMADPAQQQGMTDGTEPRAPAARQP